MTNDFDYYGKLTVLNGSDVTLAVLITWADELAMRFWGVNYTGTMELTSRKWTCRRAVYVWDRSKGLAHIRFSRPTNAKCSVCDIRQWLAHELVHWRLQTTGVPHRDVHYEFIAECIRVGGNISMAPSAQLAFRQYELDKRMEANKRGRTY